MTKDCRRLRARALWKGIAVVMLFMATAQARDFAVNSTVDTVDATPGDGTCADASNNCTLRAAIQEANAWVGADIITLPPGVFQLSITGTGDETAATGDLDVTEALIITGAGSGAEVISTIIDGGDYDRVFDIAPNGVPFNTTFNRLAIRNGTASSASGGGILVRLGTVVLNDCSLNGNHADVNGGAISNAGSLTLNQCVLNANTSNSNGGGLYNGSTATLNNSTLSGNTATTSGGGLYNATTATLLHATIASNSAASGGGLYSVGTITLKSTLLNANTGGNCSGTVSSSGNNLDSGASCAFGAAGDLSNIVNPLLGALADNGGPTATHALLTSSPAIDAADNAVCPATDQRGVTRPVDGDGNGSLVCDIGAFETTTPADLSVRKSHQADCLNLHDPLIYTISVTNNGPGDASSVTVTDYLPVGAILVSTSTACSQNGVTLTCAIGMLSAGGTASITLNTTADKVALLTNTVSVRAVESDPDLSNNSAEVQTRINCAKECFIATAAYGSALAPQVRHLRVFRDRFLTPNPLGRWFVDLYYRYSPALAEVLREHDSLRAVVRTGILPLVEFAKFANDTPSDRSDTRP